MSIAIIMYVGLIVALAVVVSIVHDVIAGRHAHTPNEITRKPNPTGPNRGGAPGDNTHTHPDQAVFIAIRTVEARAPEMFLGADAAWAMRWSGLLLPIIKNEEPPD
jgi:hypothetical protein